MCSTLTCDCALKDSVRKTNFLTQFNVVEDGDEEQEGSPLKTSLVLFLCGQLDADWVERVKDLKGNRTLET